MRDRRGLERNANEKNQIKKISASENLKTTFTKYTKFTR
jgi:hypothetical protein